MRPIVFHNFFEPDPPPVIELDQGVGVFGLRIKPGMVRRAQDETDLTRYLVDEALEALTWIVENRRGDVIFPAQGGPSNYAYIQLSDERDMTLFKLHWING